MPARKPVTSPFTKHNSIAPLTDSKTSWDLVRFFYKDENDPQIEKDVAMTEAGYSGFARKYNKKEFTATAKTLASALREYHELAHLPGEKAIRYFHYRRELNAEDHVAEQRTTLLSDRLTKAGNLLVFFHLALGKIPKKLQAAYLREPSLTPYRYYLERVFLTAKHTLTEAEEKIINLKSLPARSLWVSGTDKIINRKSVSYRGKRIPLNEAIERVSTIAPKERPVLWSVITRELEHWAEVAENELNAIVLDKKINDELRGYKKPYEAKVQSYENNLASVEALVASVTAEGFSLSHRYHRVKASFHGAKALPYANRYDPVAKEITIPFADAVEICREVFYKTKHEYGQIFDAMLTEGRIDVYPRANRSGGAFMASGIDQPPLVFLNQVDTFKSLETLAHEMGHAIHSTRSKAGQPSWYEDYSTTTAETASTFFENLVFSHVYEQADDKLRFALLHDRLGRDISTIERQIAFFNFELELHTRIREEGGLTKDAMAILMQKHLQSYLGPAVSVTKEDGYSFVYVGHFRSMFYVYTYAYGLLMSTLMHQRYTEDPRYIEKIDTFLQSGGKDTVENIFASIGIAAHKPETFVTALNARRVELSEFERLAKQLK